jgi:hypothetical protein
VFSHYKTSWRGENFLLLSLFSHPVSMAVLVQEFSSRTLGIISAKSTSNVSLLLFVPDLHLLILRYYTGNSSSSDYFYIICTVHFVISLS